jgi:hypothetical protein
MSHKGQTYSHPRVHLVHASATYFQKVALSLIADTELQEPDFNGPCPSLYVLPPWTEAIDAKRARSFRSPAVCY